MAGGGPLGMIYEIGALRASMRLWMASIPQSPCYVGVSAGAVVACPLVNQFTTAQMCRVFIRNDPPNIRSITDVFDARVWEYWKRLKSIPGLFWIQSGSLSGIPSIRITGITDQPRSGSAGGWCSIMRRSMNISPRFSTSPDAPMIFVS